jgi:hypothetical protein
MIQQQPPSTHPLLKAAVVVAGGVLVVLLVMSVLSVLMGAFWDVLRIALFVAVVAGIWHMVRRHRSATGHGAGTGSF